MDDVKASGSGMEILDAQRRRCRKGHSPHGRGRRQFCWENKRLGSRKLTQFWRFRAWKSRYHEIRPWLFSAPAKRGRANGPTVVLKRLRSAGRVTADVEDGIDVETEGFD